MPYNVTEIAQMTGAQIADLAHKMSAVPALVILFIVSQLSFLVIGIIMVYFVGDTKNKFIAIWVITFLANLVFLTVLVAFPGITQVIVELIPVF